MDPLEAILAVPGAIDACKNIIGSIVGHLKDDGKKHANDLEQSIDSIVTNLVRFTDASEALRGWKAIHHITSNILFIDLLRTFEFFSLGEQPFIKKVVSGQRAIKDEFFQLMRGRNGACVLISTLSREDRSIQGLNSLVQLSGSDWGEHLLQIAAQADKAFAESRYTDLYAVIGKLQKDCTVLNVHADSQLKEGIGKIAEALHDVRVKLKSAH
jgi:hypothetical protein